jgi:hypothetical protein
MDPAVVDVAFEERYWYPHDGGVVWVAGYQLVDPESGRYLARDAPQVLAAGLLVVKDAVAPGRALMLRRDPDNAHDPNAVAVHPAGGGPQVGWVPREVAGEVAAELDAGRPLAAVAMRERRPSPRDPRSGLTMLVARAPAIELRVHGQGAQPS